MDELLILAGGQVHHELVHAPELCRQVHRSLVGAGADPRFVAQLPGQDARRLQDLRHREGDVRIRHLQLAHLRQGPQDRLSRHRCGVVAVVHFHAAGLGIAAGAVFQKDHVMAELAPVGDHGFSQQSPVSEHLGHRQARRIGGPLKTVQVDRDSIGLPQIDRCPYPFNRAHLTARSAPPARNARRSAPPAGGRSVRCCA